MATPVKVKWGKKLLDVSIDKAETPSSLMDKLYGVSGVPVERQKIMGKGLWSGVLKKDASFDKPFGELNWAKAKLVMMGTSTGIPEKPKEAVVFLEDMTAAEQLKTGKVLPAGLENLGNTCYLNSTVQCIKAIPEFREALDNFSDASAMEPGTVLTKSLRDTFRGMDNEPQSYTPMGFVGQLRRFFPQFAQQGPHGGFVQHDSDEFFNELMNALSQKVKNPPSITSGPVSQNAVDTLFGIEMSVKMKCKESDAEPVVTSSDSLRRLQCNITADTTFLEAGIKLGLEGELEKRSDILDRNAVWDLSKRMSKLPKYLVVQLNRFFWKRTPDSRDHTGVNCKIMKPLKFPPVLDVFDFCDEKVQKKLKIYRDAYAEEVLDGKKKDTDAMDTEEQDPEVKAALALSMEADLDTSPVGPGIPANFRGMYELFGVVTHKGRASNSGHYMGWVKQDKKDSWVCFDDDHASECKEEDVLTKLVGGGDYHMAYVVFYRVKE